VKTLLSLFLLSATAFAADLPYKDTDFACVSQADANRYVSDYGIDVSSFGGMELCNSAKDTKKLFNDLSLIEKSEFNADNGHSFIRGFVPANTYYSWMKSQTRGMNRGNDIPWATAYNSGGYFTMQDGWAALSTLGRVGTVIHEARHTAGYRHYACSHGPYGGASSAGCDTSFSQGGSHGVEMEYYARVVLLSKNLHPAYKSMARLMALGRSNFVFNETPMRAREALVGLAGNRIVMIDNNDVVERETPVAAEGSVLKRTSFGASLVKGQKAVAVDLYGFSNNGYSMEDDYSYYKLYKTPRPGGPGTVQAIEEIDVGTKRYFAVLADGGKVFSYNFPEGAWHPASFALSGATTFVTRAPGGEFGLFAVKTDGSVVPFDLTNRTFGAPLRERWSSDTRAYAKMGNTLLRLTAAGEVVNAATGEAIEPFAKRTVTDLVNVPLYDTFEVVR
jgi:hypothetical protein